MRRTGVLLSMCLIVILVFSQMAMATPVSPKRVHIGYPSYEKLNLEESNENAAATTAKGKELNTPSGKAYLKPGSGDPLAPKDVRGSKKGIAILVDFPVPSGSVSDVPDVNYSQLPKDMFDTLLNGTRYDPYKNPLFKPLGTFTDKWTGQTYQAPTNGTLRNYYNEVSYGQFSIDVDVTGWIMLPHSYDYYVGQNKGYYNDNGDAHMYELIRDAINAADQAGVDFSQYAVSAQPGDFDDLYGNSTSFVDGNGNTINKVVPNIFVIHRGAGAEYGGLTDIIWSHKWSLVGAEYYGRYYQTGVFPSETDLGIKVVDGVAVNTYNICPEVNGMLRGGGRPNPPSVGVFAHEFGHVLGLPDQYDYGYESNGTGFFSVMASGSSGRIIPRPNYTGTTPVHMDAWSKIYLGFIQPEQVQVINPMGGSKTVTLKPLAQAPDVAKIVVPGSNGREYFLLENRQQVGFDRGLGHSYYNNYNVGPSAGIYDRSQMHGLVVWHINEDILGRSFNRPNEAQNWDLDHRGLDHTLAWTGEHHYGISVVQADGRFDLEHGTNDADARDPFPGTLGVTKLSPKLKDAPNTASIYMWNTATNETDIAINNIVEQDGNVTFTVSFTK